jgi:hypothetical protein
MRELVGVISGLSCIGDAPLKRAALMCHRVGVTNICSFFQHLTEMERLGGMNQHPLEEISKAAAIWRKLPGLKELEWLVEQGIAFAPESLYNEYSLDLSNKEFRKYDKVMSRAEKEFQEVQWERRMLKSDFMMLGIKEETGPLWDKVNKKHEDAWNKARDAEARRAAAVLRGAGDFDVVPLVSVTPPAAQKHHAGKTDVLQIVVDNLPTPNESTPWEQIIEYRSDPDSRSRFLALRHWMSEVARAQLTPAEVEEKLVYLVDQYQKHMKLHRMKTNVCTFETIVTTGAEVLGDLVSFKWGKAAQALFSLKKRQVALLEGELTAPGNEVAYIVKAREAFS